MKLKRIHAFYAIFFFACFAIFVLMNERSEGQSRQNSDAILIALITAFSAFIVFHDFRRRLPASQIIVPILGFVLLNVLAIAFIYVAEVAFSAGVIIPLFMIEGAVVYWLLERRASALNDENNASN